MKKPEVLRSLERLPDEATIEDVIEHLYFVWKIEQRIAAADTAETLTQEEVEERIRHWRE